MGRGVVKTQLGRVDRSGGETTNSSARRRWSGWAQRGRDERGGPRQTGSARSRSGQGEQARGTRDKLVVVDRRILADGCSEVTRWARYVGVD